MNAVSCHSRAVLALADNDSLLAAAADGGTWSSRGLGSQQLLLVAGLIHVLIFSSLASLLAHIAASSAGPRCMRCDVVKESLGYQLACSCLACAHPYLPSQLLWTDWPATVVSYCSVVENSTRKRCCCYIYPALSLRVSDHNNDNCSVMFALCFR